MKPRTLFQKVWERHVVAREPGRPAILYVDLQLLHEVTSPQAFAVLRERGLRVRRPDRTFATMDHSTPTDEAGWASVGAAARAQLELLARNCEEYGIRCFPLGDPRNGIVHVIGPELGLTRPGQTIVCGDSHTATHGAFGALAFGIGTSEVAHVLATQCLLQARPKTLNVRFEGRPGPGVSAKDLILAVCAELGVGGATGHVIEYTGEAVRALDMEGRMTVCNMSIEAGARAGMIAPDETTFEYLHGREHSPRGRAWDAALRDWRGLSSDEGATYDRTLTLDASALEPMISYGTHPGMSARIGAQTPETDEAGVRRALDYMGFEAGAPLAGRAVDVVFIGSCTNSRIGDLREAARIFLGRRVAEGVRALIVPGSQAVKAQAEAEGLDAVFRDAGAEWRSPGCSMCIAMNGDRLAPGQVAVSTSNRNFEGRQGRGGRTLLASPATAAAAAVTGRVTDPRSLEGAPA